jgi:CRP/FNR family transcriptional regulator, anaerobic regulatory protein
MAPRQIIDFVAIRSACENCRLAALCLPAGLEIGELKRLEQLVRRPHPLRRGETLFRASERMHAVYAVRAGSFRTYYLAEDGREKVLGFHLPGELLGFDGLGSGRHRCTADALETASVCELPVEQLQELADRLPSLNHQLYRLMSQEIAHDQEIMLLLSDKNAQERLATFLLNLAQRFAERGFSAGEFHLSMSRQNIANYLGLTLETVSRTFSHFQKDGLLSVERRHVRLLDKQGLAAVAGLGRPASSSTAT